MHTAVPRAAACALYRRRRPEHTPLYRTVQGHLETCLALARAGHEDGEGAPQLLPEHMRSRVPQ
jgi:hypothetical protein